MLTKFLIQIILVDVAEKQSNLTVRAATPEEAGLEACSRDHDNLPRRVEPGDGLIISNPIASFTGYYVADIGNKLRKMKEGEFLIWRAMMKTNPMRKQGIEAALGIIKQKV